jgi:hypothetical protein
MTKATSKKADASETVDSVKETLQSNMKSAMDSYFDGLEKSQKQLAEDVITARARSTRIMDSFLQTMAKSQTDMLELSRAVAAAPTDYKANLERVMETMTRRQECAIELSKTLYREQSEMTSAMTERAQEMFSSMKDVNYDWAAPYKSMASFWTAGAK